MKRFIKISSLILFCLFSFWAGTGFLGFPPDRVVEHQFNPVYDMSIFGNVLYYNTVDPNTKKVVKHEIITNVGLIEFLGDVKTEAESYVTYKTSTYWLAPYDYTLHTTEVRARFLLR